MTATQSELKTMNDKQMKLINLQEKYSQEVKGSASKIINESYNQIEKYQTETLDKIYNNTQKSADKLAKTLDNAVNECRQAVKRTEVSSGKLYKLATWRDLMWYSAPLLVLLDVIFRVIPLLFG
jgi:methionyl-tRNA synthetase